MSQSNQPPDSTRKNGEGLVVTEGGVRASGNVHPTQESAASEADQLRKRRLHEKSGTPAPAVKQQLFG